MLLQKRLLRSGLLRAGLRLRLRWCGSGHRRPETAPAKAPGGESAPLPKAPKADPSASLNRGMYQFSSIARD